ncbi:3-hydroxyacyl-CoA dehydrogenase family protein [Streptomyces sp. NPDC057445]|uniref:3-hydroxyacyl-CoA dehydrogenase family protein n=1 Tax=Streptomyces sp. NPDC057445 TaxID=3346136 RepID=UPI0036ABCE67
MTTHPEGRSALAIVGLGSVGESLLRLALAAGHEVVAVDHDPDVLARAARRAKAATATGSTDGICFTDDYARLGRASLVVEAVPEDPDTKTEVLRRIAEAAPRAVLVTTTAQLPLTRLAIASGRPEAVAALRFLVPPGPGGPVEPVRTALTVPGTAAALDALIASLGLTPVSIGSRPAADATALVLSYLNRAVVFLDQGHASRDDIDTAMRLGCGLPQGPLELLDTMGLDTARTALTRLWRRTGDVSFEPAPLLTRMVTAGALGRKSGEGFHAYDDQGRPLRAPAPPPDATPVRPLRTVGVLGSGAMARGIAEVTAAAGHPTTLVARSHAKAAAALESVEASLTRSVRRGRTTPEARAAALRLLDSADDLAALADCDLVIEAVAEDMEVKRERFAALGRAVKPGALLATTTSSLSVADCATASGRPADVIGLHFFNPAPLMKLVEVVRTGRTSGETAASAQAFAAGLGRTTVDCPDRAGFIVNALLFPYLGAAVGLLRRPHTGIEETDAAVEHGFGFPMGPFALLDTIGLDVSLAIQNRLYDQLGTPEHLPSPLLSALVATGALGRKNGRGFRTAVPRSPSRTAVTP